MNVCGACDALTWRQLCESCEDLRWSGAEGSSAVMRVLIHRRLGPMDDTDPWDVKVSNE
jgi:hypothetical protein